MDQLWRTTTRLGMLVVAIGIASLFAGAMGFPSTPDSDVTTFEGNRSVVSFVLFFSGSLPGLATAAFLAALLLVSLSSQKRLPYTFLQLMLGAGIAMQFAASAAVEFWFVEFPAEDAYYDWGDTLFRQADLLFALVMVILAWQWQPQRPFPAWLRWLTVLAGLLHFMATIWLRADTETGIADALTFLIIPAWAVVITAYMLVHHPMTDHEGTTITR